MGKKEKRGFATIVRIWGTHITYVAFDCDIDGHMERIIVHLSVAEGNRFLKENFEGDVGFLVAKGERLRSWKPVSAENPLPLKYQVKVFLSYSQKWSHYAEYICQFLKKYGLTVWLDKERLLVGDQLDPEITKEILSATYFVPLFSQDYLNSEWCLREFELAVQTPQVTILPIKVSDEALIMPPYFHQLYKEQLGEPLFLDIKGRGKEMIPKLRKFAEYLREGHQFPKSQNFQSPFIPDIPSSPPVHHDQPRPQSLPEIDALYTKNGQIESNRAKPDSVPELMTVNHLHRQDYERKLNAIIQQTEIQTRRQKRRSIITGIIVLIIGFIAWMFTRELIVIIPAMIVAYFIGQIFQLIASALGIKTFKKELSQSDLDHSALLELQKRIESHQQLHKKLKQKILKSIKQVVNT